MITVQEWAARIDAFLEEENRAAGRVLPVHRIYCRDDSDRSGGGIYNELVTEDLIGRFARALGDSNPLYSDPRYAADSSWGGIIAPPLLECCICSTFLPGRFPRLRGIDVFDAGTRWERFLPIRPGDSFTAKTRYLGIEEIRASRGESGPASGENCREKPCSEREQAAQAGPAFEKNSETGSEREDTSYGTPCELSPRLLLRSHEIILTNQWGETVSRLTARSIIKCSPPNLSGKGKSEKSGSIFQGEACGLRRGEPSAPEEGRECLALRPRYREEELRKIYENLDAQFDGTFRRGRKPLRWEELELGEELPEQIVGPYDESDGFSLMAAIGAANAFATKWGTIRSRRRIEDPVTGAFRNPIDRHFSDEAARAQGLPRAVVSGIHTQALLAKAVSDWMGDDGFLCSLDCRCRRPLYYGDISVQRGRVVGKSEEIWGRFAVLRMEGVRRDGTVHTEAEAVVRISG